ncbi:hypothetical protein BH11BAC4_BH11BAC4_07760 [soil metagenome]
MAQQLGFAENNLVLDVKGFDAVNKLTILTMHSLGVFNNPAILFLAV